MLYGESYQKSQDQPQGTWVDLLVASSPHGVMQVLARNGYSGYLAPQNQEELTDAAYDFVEKKGEDAVVELLKAHPLYDVISEISTGAYTKKSTKSFSNATGDTSLISAVIPDSLKTIDFRKATEAALIIIGILWVANYIYEYLSLKKE
jgi:hypothetical protein